MRLNAAIHQAQGSQRARSCLSASGHGCIGSIEFCLICRNTGAVDAAAVMKPTTSSTNTADKISSTRMLVPGCVSGS